MIELGLSWKINMWIWEIASKITIIIVTVIVIVIIMILNLMRIDYINSSKKLLTRLTSGCDP